MTPAAYDPEAVLRCEKKLLLHRRLRNWLPAAPFVLPGLILACVFILYPMLFNIRISFSNYQIVQRSMTWVGLDNYIALFTERGDRLLLAIRNNFLYAFVTTPFKRPTDPYKWATKTVVHILERLDYLGHTVNFKTSKQSFKSKKVLLNDPADWVIFENTQEPIIEESVFLIVQKIRQGRRRPTKMGDMGMFSGLLFCADCGGKMYLCRANHFKPEQEYYLCSTYRKDRTLCSTHSIRRVVLEEIVLRNLREAIQYVTQYEDDFVQRAADQSLRERDKELAQKKDTLAQSQKRIAELDVIIKRLYEDNISGKLSDERFIKLSRDYELEQTNLTNLVEHLRQEVKEQEKQKVNVRQFIAAVRKYTDMQQLDASILREFVDKIYISEVYTPDENEPRIKVREIEIVYNFIGAFDFEEAREQSQAAQKEKKTGVA